MSSLDRDSNLIGSSSSTQLLAAFLLPPLAWGCGQAAHPRGDEVSSPLVAADAWWTLPTPCPTGARLVGDAPPKGTSIQCLMPDGLRHGRFTRWYPSLSMETNGEYVLGRRSGRWRQWTEYGNLLEERWFASVAVCIVDEQTGRPAVGVYVAIVPSNHPGAEGFTDEHGLAVIGSVPSGSAKLYAVRHRYLRRHFPEIDQSVHLKRGIDNHVSLTMRGLSEMDLGTRRSCREYVAPDVRVRAPDLTPNRGMPIPPFGSGDL